MAATPNSIITPQTINSPTPGVLLSTAMTSTKAFDGTDTLGTAMASVYTAGANGSQLPPLRIKLSSLVGTLPSGSTTATVVRIWLNNASPNTTTTNNILFDEVAIPATTYTATGATTQYTYDFNNMVIPANWRVLVGMASTLTLANAALAVSMPGGGDL